MADLDEKVIRGAQVAINKVLGRWKQAVCPSCGSSDYRAYHTFNITAMIYEDEKGSYVLEEDEGGYDYSHTDYICQDCDYEC